MTNKLNEFIFEYFAPITKKQWKQKIQFQLNGADYQETLIKTIAEGVDTLPFYTLNDLDKILDYSFSIKTEKTICIEITNEIEANKKAIKYIKNGAQAIYFICYSKTIEIEKVIENINIPVIISCHFLNASFLQKIENKKNIELLVDPLGKLNSTGNWYRSQDQDFEKLNSLIENKKNNISINLNHFNNAGADYIQQLAYSISLLKDYAKNTLLTKENTFTYIVSVSTEMYHEIAKLKALRILHNIAAKKLNIDVNCKIILVKNKRNTRATEHHFNTLMLHTEQLIGFAAQVNFVCSMPNANYFTNVDLNKQDEEVFSFLNTDFHEQSSLFLNSVFIEKLTQQFIEKTIDLVHNIEQGNGYIVQFKKGIIQQKIFEKALKQQKQYTEKFKNFATAQFLNNKKAIQYPFFKNEEKNSQYKPITTKRLHAPLEKPLWDQFFSNE